ncbi:ABC transporter ATP-binding protein [Desulfotalea psychrophila]|uniref:Probable dipeptide ABC transporter, ATP-binding protein (DppF) n=1 Tax=Desulfotalea psychrophila (strain LSv54 / DSM 12343) TaxID=177439 RepID=Q6ARZ5_DESPS|nr:oligopeptide/dipeptide ABC transporter ATP-binding protein [Desulfotalea psychrophila]CAG34880.1 probable dipeptide ABC transporter, ATP-binding protein (DppF) [Desulfotalea psychrophila LSv54]
MKKDTLVSIQNVVKHFDISGGLLEQIRFKNNKFVREQSVVHALNGVSLDIGRGKTVSVVGESGCGKSTLARCVIRLYEPNGGQIIYDGKRIDNLSHKHMAPYRTRMQMVFQDPYSSLNPRMSVAQILEEPIRFHNRSYTAGDVTDKVAEVMQQVGIDPLWRKRFPHEFSGGQRQRIAIARALAVDPEFIVADEPIAALDVSIQAQVLNLLMDLQQERGLTYMFISHDLSVVEHISNEVAVMYLGTLCEFAETENLYSNPRHPYTRALLSAIPQFGQKGFQHLRLQGDVPTPIDLPSGCVFHGRCPYADKRCRTEMPIIRRLDCGSQVACHGVEEGRI